MIIIKNKMAVVFVFITIVILLSNLCLAMDRPPKDLPTATVIDDETGKPIEGAVAIAIWRGRTGDCALMEGLLVGCWGVKRIEEVVSDKDGVLNISDFWKTTKDPGSFGTAYNPRLTVYKFGYVCWDHQRIFQPNYKWGNRTDFDKNNRIVRLKKWPEGFPYKEHLSFMSGVTNGDASNSQYKLFNKCFDLERDYRSKEINNK